LRRREKLLPFAGAPHFRAEGLSRAAKGGEGECATTPFGMREEGLRKEKGAVISSTFPQVSLARHEI